MKRITINFEYCRAASEDIVLETQSYYDSDKSDYIRMTKRRITIIAERGNKNKPDNLLTNINSTLYLQLLKAIVYVYMTEGKAFDIGEVIVTVNGKSERYYANDIVNPCPNNLDTRFIINKCQCEKILVI